RFKSLAFTGEAFQLAAWRATRQLHAYLDLSGHDSTVRADTYHLSIRSSCNHRCAAAETVVCYKSSATIDGHYCWYCGCPCHFVCDVAGFGGVNECAVRR